MLQGYMVTRLLALFVAPFLAPYCNAEQEKEQVIFIFTQTHP